MAAFFKYVENVYTQHFPLPKVPHNTMNFIEKQALNFLLKHTQEQHRREMEDFVVTHWAQYRAGEIDFKQIKQLAQQTKPWLKPERVAEITEFSKTWARRLNLK